MCRAMYKQATTMMIHAAECCCGAMDEYIDADVKATELSSSSDDENFNFFADKSSRAVNVNLEFFWVCFL